MSDRVLIPLPGVGTLVLSAGEFAAALERGRGLLPNGHAEPAGNGEPERLLTAEEISAATSIPASWWAEAARGGAVPAYYFGKYPRFRLSEVLACPKFRERGA